MITATQKEEILWLPFPKPSQILRQSKTANFKLWGHCFKRHSLKICSGIWCNVSQLQKHNEDDSSYVNLSDSSSNNPIKVTDLCSKKECSCPSTISDNLMEIVDSLETENYVTKMSLKYMMLIVYVIAGK